MKLHKGYNIVLYICIVTLLIQCKSKNSNGFYISVSKWTYSDYTRNQKDSDICSLYDFQSYSLHLITDPYFSHYYNIDENLVKEHLRGIYQKNQDSINLLNVDSCWKFIKNPDRDTSMLLLDLMVKNKNDISLLSLGNAFATIPWGSGQSGRENYLIRQNKDSLVFLSELPHGILIGVRYSSDIKIEKLYFQDFIKDVGNVVFVLVVTEQSISFESILNVRNGEPLDFTDNNDFLKSLKQYKFQHTY